MKSTTKKVIQKQFTEAELMPKPVTILEEALAELPSEELLTLQMALSISLRGTEVGALWGKRLKRAQELKQVAIYAGRDPETLNPLFI